jgi:hypothetical protein
MNELDAVHVRQTVMARLITGDLQVEISAGWTGTIVECADTRAPMVEFIEYRDEPIIVHVEATNLEVIRPSK